jgi:uncharacterized protein with ParB-like and HNH nuclease domain
MSYSSESKTVAFIIKNIHDYYLPAIQRKLVWDTGRIEGLFDSLLRGYPIGTLLFWNVQEEGVRDFQFYELIRNYDERRPNNVKADLRNRKQCVGILDGQQRMTALYIGLQGSFTEKLPRRRRNNPDAYPEKKLYINLLYQPKPDDDQRFQIKFLTKDQTKNSKTAYWFQFGDILKFDSRDALRDFRRSTEYKDNVIFDNTLDTLWFAIHDRQSITYFIETNQDLDQVLDVFVRLNRGGVPLTNSDLLLSLATATWKQHDAREEVSALVDYLNKNGGNFEFEQDFVLKTLLVLSDRDVRFKTENIKKKAQLETAWAGTQVSLKLTVKLLRSFGFDGRTLTAPNAVIPIAYYLNRRQLDDGFITQQKYQQDRETIRIWLLKVLLGRVFAGQTDRILTNIRSAIQAEMNQNPNLNTFPAEHINTDLRKIRSYTFTQDEVERLVSDIEYGDRYAFAVLALLCPQFDFTNNQFHVDHIHPKSFFNEKELRQQGMNDEQIQFALNHFNALSNLQLLPGVINEAKRATPFAKWLQEQKNQKWHREFGFIPEVDLPLKNFQEFYEARKLLLIDALKAKLEYVETEEPEETPDETELLVTGEVSG